MCVGTHLCLSDGPLNIIVSEGISNGVPNPNAVPLNQQVVIHDFLNVSIKISRHFVIKFTGNDMHERPGLVSQCVL